MAGIAGAATDNGLDVAGLAFASPIISVRVFHDDPDYGWIANDSDVADGIAWAAQHGAKAINLSLGGTGDTKAPVVHVYGARGRRGTMLRLRYRVSDDKGETTERISVYRRTRALRRFARPLRPTDVAVAYWLAWRAPKHRRLVSLLRPRHGRRGQPQPADLRADQRPLTLVPALWITLWRSPGEPVPAGTSRA